MKSQAENKDHIYQNLDREVLPLQTEYSMCVSKVGLLMCPFVVAVVFV